MLGSDRWHGSWIKSRQAERADDVSVATTIRPPATIYREEQFFAWWIYTALGAIIALGWGSLAWKYATRADHSPTAPPISLIVGLVLPPALILGILRMTTEVAPGGCRIAFGFVPTYRRSIPLDLVSRVEVTAYRAFRDHLFWGVHTSRDGERVMTARGSRAVRLHLIDGSRLLIGSQTPEALAAAIELAMRPIP